VWGRGGVGVWDFGLRIETLPNSVTPQLPNSPTPLSLRD
jgi:hypothetical protein